MTGRGLGRCAGVVAVSLVACHKTPSADVADGKSEIVGADALGSAAAQEAGAPAVGPSRCHAAKGQFAIDDGRGLEDLEIGDAIASGQEIAVGLVHRVAAGRVAAVALVRSDSEAAPRIVDLGPTPGDAPPAGLARRPSDLVAAAYAVAGTTTRSRGRPLALYAIKQDKAEPIGAIDQAWDDSFAFDMAAAGDKTLVVWDEASGAGRGVIRVAVVGADGHVGPTHDVSPQDSDAETPRVVVTGNGFAVIWIARAAEPTGAPSDASAPEAVGESRVPGWLETIAVDENGVASGTARRLTSPSGHVSGYDVAPIGSGAAPSLLVVARDESEGSDESGGQLLRVRVTGDTVESAVPFTTDGLGRGAPLLAKGAAPWLSWAAHDESLRLLALDPTGAPVGLPSVEPSLDEARPLVVAAAGSHGTDRMLAAFPADATGQLRTFECPR
jgi:hypothetical protein